MKLIVLLLAINLMQITASVYSQNTSFKVENTKLTLQEAIKAIESQTEYRIAYSATFVDQRSFIEFEKNVTTVESFLEEINREMGIGYLLLENDVIVLTNKGDKLLKQQITIKGKVTDVNGNPLPGVNVVEKGTTVGAVTNLDGEYSISVSSANSIISFSYVGFLTEDIEVSGQSTIDMTMVEDITSLDEVVVIGYGSVKKSDLTGSVGSLDSEMLTVKGTTSPMEALQGQVAGVNIVASSGRAGADYEIKIRGDNSLLGGNPLYVVDGIVTDNIQFLNPQDIERMDILKDASSTAIYGSRGSNGVVIVTTKQASSDNKKPIISYDGYYGLRKASHLPELMGGDDYWEYRQNAYLGAEFHSGKDITSSDYDQEWVDSRSSYASSEVLRNVLSTKNYTDWMNLMIEDGSQQNHWLSIAGNSNNMSYLFGLGYQNEDGIFYNEWFDRYNFKASINHKISEKWSAGTNVNFAITEQELGGDLELREAFIMPPVVSPYIPEGYENAGELSLVPAQSYGMGITASLNPLITRTESRNNNRQLYMLGNVYLQYTPIKGLNIKSTLSSRIINQRVGRYEGSQSQTRKLLDPAADLTQKQSLFYIWDNQITYDKTIGEHKFNLMGLHSINYFKQEGSYIAVENLPFESLWYNVGSAPDIEEVTSNYSKVTLASVLGRVNYIFKDKYFVTASFRTDGSSKLGEGNKWATFPSAALAWRISEENFLQNVNVISNLKLRASYGYTGNNNISAYSTLTYASNQKYYDFDGTVANGFAPSNIANTELTWEKTRELNAGFDFGLFGNRINGSIDVYDKLSSELLLGRKLPVESGWTSVTANIGSVSNKGVELALNTINVHTKDLMWETTFTFSKNVNAIEELYGTDEDDLGNLWFIGEPVNVNYTYVFDGIWKANETSEAAGYGQSEGQAKVKDLDNSGAIEANNDRTIIGTPDPSWAGSFSTTIRFKKFDFNASLYTQQDVQVYSDFHFFYTRMRDRYRNKLDIDYYMADNNVTGFRDSDEYPMPRNEGTYWDQVGYYKDASFVKVKNISLGYTFNTTKANLLNLTSFRVYANVLNPFIFTDYDGYDPEWADSRFGGGVSTTTYQLGVNVKF